MGSAVVNLSPTAQAALSGNLDAAKKHAKEAVRDAWQRELDEVGMPINGYDFRVDFGIEDSLIWEGGLALDTSDEVSVRAIDNTMHTIPREIAVAVPEMQRTHYAQVLQKKWALQQRIEAANSVEEVRSVKWI